jgi:uncharacterized protein
MFNKLIIWIFKGYQVLISPMFPPSCRFYPTCSEYSIQAFKTYSFPKAFLLSGWRILRCNPFHKGGYDPIKERTET